MARLETETAAAKTKAFAAKRSLTSVEASLAEIAELRRLKTANPPVIRVLDELTRLLPDTAWVSNLKIEGEALEVTDRRAYHRRAAEFARPLVPLHRRRSDRPGDL